MKKLRSLYERLIDRFGKQGWWPGDSKFEIIVGAILTQNVSWKNVETAIDNLRRHNLLKPIKLKKADDRLLHDLIRPTGFYRQKTSRLKRMTELIIEEGGIEDLLGHDDLRNKLLEIKGIGPETADSIILYAAGKPSFVVDAYTFRILKRIYDIQYSYDEVKEMVESTFDNDISKLQELHALIVELGKNYCSKNEPVCDDCPFSDDCLHANQR